VTVWQRGDEYPGTVFLSIIAPPLLPPHDPRTAQLDGGDDQHGRCEDQQGRDSDEQGKSCFYL